MLLPGTRVYNNKTTFERPGLFINYTSVEQTEAVILWNGGDLDTNFPVADISEEPDDHAPYKDIKERARVGVHRKMRVRLGLLREFIGAHLDEIASSTRMTSRSAPTDKDAQVPGHLPNELPGSAALDDELGNPPQPGEVDEEAIVPGRWAPNGLEAEPWDHERLGDPIGEPSGAEIGEMDEADDQPTSNANGNLKTQFKKYLPKGIGKFLGEGDEGQVYVYGPDKVIKVSSGTRYDINTMLHRIEFAKKQADPDFVNIHDTNVQHFNDDRSMMYVIMDRLKPLSDDEQEAMFDYFPDPGLSNEIERGSQERFPELGDFLERVASKHDDINPENVMKTANGSYKLVDPNAALVDEAFCFVGDDLLDETDDRMVGDKKGNGIPDVNDDDSDLKISPHLTGDETKTSLGDVPEEDPSRHIGEAAWLRREIKRYMLQEYPAGAGMVDPLKPPQGAYSDFDMEKDHLGTSNPQGFWYASPARAKGTDGDPFRGEDPQNQLKMHPNTDDTTTVHPSLVGRGGVAARRAPPIEQLSGGSDTSKTLGASAYTGGSDVGSEGEPGEEGEEGDLGGGEFGEDTDEGQGTEQS